MTSKNIIVLSWNTLADSLTLSSPSYDAFPKVSHKTLEWKFRKELLIEIIHKYRPDIVCLYEVDHYDDWFKLEMYKRGFESHWCKKLSEGNLDGTAIFWKNTLFNFPKIVILPYDNRESQFAFIAEFTGFKDSKNPKPFIIASTHLKSKPSFEERRLRQGTKLLDELKHMRFRKDKPIPTIICGDFNDVPDSLVCTIIDKSYQSCNPVKTETSDRNTSWTTWKERSDHVVKRIIDYMWVSDDIEILSESAYVSDVDGPLPSEEFPSDHLPIVGVFRL